MQNKGTRQYKKKMIWTANKKMKQKNEKTVSVWDKIRNGEKLTEKEMKQVFDEVIREGGLKKPL